MSNEERDTTSEPLDTAVIAGAVALLSTPGVWMQRGFVDGHRVCAHGAVLRQHCTPGDKYLWRAVMRFFGLTEKWNDGDGRIVDEVIDRFAAVRAVTETDMGAVFGPQWQAVRDMVRRVAVLTDTDVLACVPVRGAMRIAARDAARSAARGTAEDAARGAAWGAARDAADDAAWGASQDAATSTLLGTLGVWDATNDAARRTAWGAARDAAKDAARALVVRDVLDAEHYDILTLPWRQVIGRIHPNDKDLT